jgi:isopentenyl diphosphate isomerase/L-lactate dehydrogenase-like FMN-dependent dehydrogenase
MYQGATATNTPLIVAGGSSIPIEKIAPAGTGPRWSQFYPTRDLKPSREQIERFQANGARAIVVTVDQQTSYTSAICTTAISAGRRGGIPQSRRRPRRRDR